VFIHVGSAQIPTQIKPERTRGGEKKNDQAPELAIWTSKLPLQREKEQGGEAARNAGKKKKRQNELGHRLKGGRKITAFRVGEDQISVDKKEKKKFREKLEGRRSTVRKGGAKVG